MPGANPACPQEYRQKTPAAQQALLRETDFAFKQAFAFCPYNVETVQRYINFLLGMAQIEAMDGQIERAAHYFDDAILVGQTCQKLDPYNSMITSLISTIKGFKEQVTGRAQALSQAAGQIKAMEETARTNPGNVQNLVVLGASYLQMQQNDKALKMFETALGRPELNLQEAQEAAQELAQLGNFPDLETAIRKMAGLAPDLPEPRCDLAALEAITGRSKDALADLKIALDLNARRLAQNPKSPDLIKSVRTDQRFNAIRGLPEFQQLVPAK
jgi:tetratricopeptide (TPR) repeat protein